MHVEWKLYRFKWWANLHKLDVPRFYCGFHVTWRIVGRVRLKGMKNDS
jgi:hypothetical protein